MVRAAWATPIPVYPPSAVITPQPRDTAWAMSEENIDVIRKAVEAFNAGDRERLFSLVDPAIEFRSAFEQQTYRGLEGLVRYREDVAAALEGFQVEHDRFVDAGGDRVVQLYRLVGRGAGSGVPVSREVAALWLLRNGKILKGQIYLDRRQALEAAGLSE
jgi:ketosteroid isomerase-like protein